MVEIDGIEESLENYVLVLTLKNPARRNAFTQAMRRRIAARIIEANGQDAVRVIILRGEGEHFCSGADISNVGTSERPGLLQSRENLKEAQSLVRAIALSAKPVIAAVEGTAFGAGLSIALASDIVVTARDAKFGIAFVKLGLIPDLGLLYSLTARVGKTTARCIIMTSEALSGEQAVQAGVADILVDKGEALNVALEKAAALAASSPLAVAMTKIALSGKMETLEDAFRIEMDLLPQLAASADFAEGLIAFKEKRPPNFTGR